MGQINIQKGIRGVFDNVERDANKLSAKGLILLSIITFILVLVASIVDRSQYMVEVRICMAILIAISLSTGIYSLLKKEHTLLHKYFLFLVWSIAIMLAVSTIDSIVVLLYAIPILLSICYYSFIYTIFVSVLNIIFAFIPYAVIVYKGSYPLDFVVLKAGSFIPMESTSLYDAVVNANIIDITETTMNMLAYGYLSTVLILVLLSFIAAIMAKKNRDTLIEQYHIARSRIEDK